MESNARRKPLPADGIQESVDVPRVALGNVPCWSLHIRHGQVRVLEREFPQAAGLEDEVLDGVHDSATLEVLNSNIS